MNQIDYEGRMKAAKTLIEKGSLDLSDGYVRVMRQDRSKVPVGIAGRVLPGYLLDKVKDQQPGVPRKERLIPLYSSDFEDWVGGEENLKELRNYADQVLDSKGSGVRDR